MKIDIIPNTPEWLDKRATGVGASDLPVIAASLGLCDNLFNKSVNQLIYEKMSKANKTNHIFQMGHDIEKIVLDKYEQDGNVIERGAFYALDDNPNIFATLDAYNIFDNTIIEVKSTDSNESEYELLLDYYKWQVLHQIYVTGFSKNNIHIYNKITEQSKCFTYTRQDAEAILPYNDWLQICQEFLIKLNKALTPDGMALIKLEHYFMLKDRMDEMDKELKELKNELVMDNPDGGVFNNYTLSKSEKTTVKYADIVKYLNIDSTAEQFAQFKTTTTEYRLLRRK